LSSILDRIFAAKRDELTERRVRSPLTELKARSRERAPALPFVAALKAHTPAIIAEIKRASPSKGDILPGLDPAMVARSYRQNGAAAISVLTDAHFKGTLDDLRAVRAAVDLPLLRKDFMFDPYQVYEARAAGADCILLILAMLEAAQASELMALAAELGMDTLVEVHDRAQRDTATELGARLLGINNRDLHTFKTDLAVTEHLAADYRGGALLVSESGIERPADIRRLHAAGARAFLIGESLLRQGDPSTSLSALTRALSETGAALG
jgi:indole-3-glycerol phosphate synthase